MKEKVLKLFIIMLLLIPTISKAEYTPDKEHSIIKHGDVIYFDTTGLDDNWANPQIYIWEKDADAYKEWSAADSLELVDGEEKIYKFTSPTTMDEKYNMIIFKNTNGGKSNQTINLGYIEKGYAYKIDNIDSSGKRIGYWYLYDKTELNERLDAAKVYQNDKQYYTTASYSNLDDLIESAENKINAEIRLQEDSEHPGKYYIEVDYDFDQIDTIIAGLQINTSLLSDLIYEETNNLSDYEKDYTPSTVDELKSALDDGTAYLNGTTTTIDGLKNAIQNINDKKNNLVRKADKTKLKDILDKMDKLNRDDYTSDSIKVLFDNETDAKNLLDNDETLQSDVDDMVSKLQSLYDKLQLKKTSVNVPKAGDNVVLFIITSILSSMTLILLKKKVTE